MFDDTERVLKYFNDVDIDRYNLGLFQEENKGIMSNNSAVVDAGNYDMALSYGNGMMNDNLNMLKHENNGMMNNNCGTVAVKNNGEMVNILPIVPPSNSGNGQVELARGFHHGNPANVNWSHEQNNGIMINNSAIVGNTRTIANSDALVLQKDNRVTNNNAAMVEVANNGMMRNNCSVATVENNGPTDNISLNILPSNSGNGHVELVQGSCCGNSMNVDCSRQRNNGIMNNSSPMVQAGNTCCTVLPEDSGMANNNTVMVVQQNNGMANSYGSIVIAENNGETRSIAPIIPLCNPSNKHVEPVHNFRHGNPAVLSWSREEQSILMENLPKYENEPALMKYVKIAAMLPKKCARDVAMRCKWMEKKQTAEEHSAGRISEEHSAQRISEDKKGKKVDTSQRTNNLPRQRKAKAPNATENKTGSKKEMEQILKATNRLVDQLEAKIGADTDIKKLISGIKKGIRAALNGASQMTDKFDDDAACPD
ncbi:protein PF14_0175-like isoform X2 [Ananas comosus]|nr:protein PF14_0175-like isoform X2 [Ananas comosus]XP_020095574.1 protein PF14_0175-like isoform X2 [Ananas comosus]XP_020095575.1 protein PF14_0175-like isoform X2 [Ananas comosus]XP_020095576.1 protein PF14_0175-like isoform X2 [Ananas comosus]